LEVRPRTCRHEQALLSRARFQEVGVLLPPTTQHGGGDCAKNRQLPRLKSKILNKID